MGFFFGEREDYITWIPFMVLSLIIILIVIAVSAFILIYFYNRIKAEYCKYQHTLKTIEKFERLLAPLQAIGDSALGNISSACGLSGLSSLSSLVGSVSSGGGGGGKISFISNIVNYVINNYRDKYACHIDRIGTGILKRVADLVDSKKEDNLYEMSLI